jgi:hypothetical protein
MRYATVPLPALSYLDITYSMSASLVLNFGYAANYFYLEPI